MATMFFTEILGKCLQPTVQLKVVLIKICFVLMKLSTSKNINYKIIRICHHLSFLTIICLGSAHSKHLDILHYARTCIKKSDVFKA